TLSGPLSTATAASGSSPSQADISSGKRLVFDAQFLGGMLQSFFIEQNGALTPIDLQALPASEAVGDTAPQPLGLSTHPSHSILYVGFTPVNKLGVYTFHDMGHLALVRTRPRPGMAICWLRTKLNVSPP